MLSKERYHIYGDVAQLARVSDWQSEGREFKSLRLHHRNLLISRIGGFFIFLEYHTKLKMGTVWGPKPYKGTKIRKQVKIAIKN